MHNIFKDSGTNKFIQWKKRIEIKRTRARKPSKIDDDAFRVDVEQYPDDYQYECAARFGCGKSSIGDALKRLRITVKKRPYAPESKTQNQRIILKGFGTVKGQASHHLFR